MHFQLIQIPLSLGSNLVTFYFGVRLDGLLDIETLKLTRHSLHHSKTYYKILLLIENGVAQLGSVDLSQLNFVRNKSVLIAASGM